MISRLRAESAKAFQQISTGAASVTMIDNHPADDYGFMGRDTQFVFGTSTAWRRLIATIPSHKKSSLWRAGCGSRLSGTSAAFGLTCPGGKFYVAGVSRKPWQSCRHPVGFRNACDPCAPLAASHGTREKNENRRHSAIHRLHSCVRFVLLKVVESIEFPGRKRAPAVSGQ
jgi:hypothetical protein